MKNYAVHNGILGQVVGTLDLKNGKIDDGITQNAKI
jgi:hypothetical protein